MGCKKTALKLGTCSHSLASASFIVKKYDFVFLKNVCKKVAISIYAGESIKSLLFYFPEKFFKKNSYCTYNGSLKTFSFLKGFKMLFQTVLFRLKSKK